MLLGDRFFKWRNQPTLEIVGIVDFLQPIPGGETIFDNYFLDNYFLRIRNTKGKGAAQACKGNLSIPDTPISNVATYWRDINNKNESRTVDISTTEDLKLFTTVTSQDRIFFSSAIIRADAVARGHNEQSYMEFIDKELEVWLGCSSNTVLFPSKNPYRKKISDIIKESKRERP